jgi:hypothetical protein
MPEPVNPPLTEQPPAEGERPSANGKQRDPFWDGDDVLYVDAAMREIIMDLRWAHEQEAAGAFVDYGGRYLAIVNRSVQAVGGDPRTIIDEAARKTGVSPNRVVLFHVEMLD